MLCERKFDRLGQRHVPALVVLGKREDVLAAHLLHLALYVATPRRKSTSSTARPKHSPCRRPKARPQIDGHREPWMKGALYGPDVVLGPWDHLVFHRCWFFHRLAGGRTFGHQLVIDSGREHRRQIAEQCVPVAVG